MTPPKNSPAVDDVGVVHSPTVASADRLIDTLGNQGERIMSVKLRKLMEELEHELRKKTTRQNVKIDTLIRKYRPTASERERSVIREHIMPVLRGQTIKQVDVAAFCAAHVGKPVSTAKKILKCFERIMQVHDEGFKLPPLVYPNKGKQWGAEHILSDEQIARVIARVHQPNQVLCWIACETTLRLGNVIGLRPCDVHLAENEIRVLQTKTGKPVAIPITVMVRKILIGLKRRPLDPASRFFPDANAKAVSVNVRRAFHRCGIPWGSFHHFRHYGACYLINKGVPLNEVRDILGHADFDSTLIYARIKKEKLHEAMKVFNG